MSQGRRGFGVTEAMIVVLIVLILGLLAAMVIPSFTAMQRHVKLNQEAMQYFQTIVSAETTSWSETGNWRPELYAAAANNQAIWKESEHFAYFPQRVIYRFEGGEVESELEVLAVLRDKNGRVPIGERRNHKAVRLSFVWGRPVRVQASGP